MSANHKRRHQTVRTLPPTGVEQSRRVLALLAARDRLARLVAEYEAHGYEDAADLFQQQVEVEQTIADLEPRIYSSRWTDWLEQDSKLAHSGGGAHPECPTCCACKQRSGEPPQAA